MIEGLSQVFDSFGLPAEVELHRERPAEVVQDRLQVDGGFEARDGFEDAFESRKVGLDEARYPRVLDLDGDPATASESGAVYLGDGGGGDGLGIELREGL